MYSFDNSFGKQLRLVLRFYSELLQAWQGRALYLDTGKTPASAEAELKSDCSLNCTVIGLERNHISYSEFRPVYH